MTNWTGVARADFMEAFEGFWPCTRGQEQQRGTLLALIEGEVDKWPVDVCIKGLRQCKVTENSNRIPTIQRVLECIREFIPRYQESEDEEPGIGWLAFVKTHDWDAHIQRLRRQGVSTKWIEAGIARWKKGEHLLTTLTGKKYIPWGPSPTWKENKRRDREPGEDG